MFKMKLLLQDNDIYDLFIYFLTQENQGSKPVSGNVYTCWQNNLATVCFVLFC